MADPPSSLTAALPPVVAARKSPSPMKSIKWSSYTVSEKKAILKKVENFMEKSGYSAQNTCTKVGISHSSFFKWQKPMPIATQIICMNKKGITQVHQVYSRPIKMTSWNLYLKWEIQGCQLKQRWFNLKQQESIVDFAIKVIMPRNQLWRGF